MVGEVHIKSLVAKFDSHVNICMKIVLLDSSVGVYFAWMLVPKKIYILCGCYISLMHGRSDLVFISFMLRKIYRLLPPALKVNEFSLDILLVTFP